ncbi:hypothetical protein [Streptomyces sp. CC219B]|uniref:hypothetical protein n=1 Tax=Streptomyces sp. CC219B TaxID=3044574 RepID=UPI0024A95D0D|nr:hypothetical protein [Streptomyces sp. CC219B]
MRWLILGALIGLLLAFPQALAVVAAITTAAVSQPFAVAFALGLLARPYLRRPRWAR